MNKLLTLIPLLLLAGAALPAAPRFVELPGDSPLITFRVVFLRGAASDPADKPGLARLTASLLSDGGSKSMTHNQIVDRFFPMAVHVSSQVDKEMTTFTAVTHIDNLNEFYSIFRAMLLEPGWRADDIKRLRDQQINFLRVSLRGNNDEELGKEILYQAIYQDRPYGWQNAGAVSGIKRITRDDLRSFYRANYTQSNLIFGIGGGYSPEFLARVKKDFASLPEGERVAVKRPAPHKIKGIRVRMVEKNTRSVAYSIGFPISVTRADPDYIPLRVAQSYFGQHRSSIGRLYQRMREKRGLNYGDYAYIEYFPRGMFQSQPDPNLARPQQIFQMWIRPVPPPVAHFTLRLAMFELNKLIDDGLSDRDFENARGYLSKYVNLLTQTKNAELGYAIDSLYYGIPNYNTYLKTGLAKLTRDDVNRAIKKHLRATDLWIAVIAKNCEQLKSSFLAGEPSPMKYNSPKPEEITTEDKIVESWKIPFQADAVEIIPVEKVFE